MGLFGKISAMMDADPVDVATEIDDNKLKYMKTRDKIQVANNPSCHPNNLRKLFVLAADLDIPADRQMIDEAIAGNPHCPASILRNFETQYEDDSSVCRTAFANPGYAA